MEKLEIYLVNIFIRTCYWTRFGKYGKGRVEDNFGFWFVQYASLDGIPELLENN